MAVLRNRENKRKIAVVVTVIIGILLFVVFPDDEYILQKDSGAYINTLHTLSVMPLYPIFIGIIRALCGIGYLNVVVIAQGMIAIVCTSLFAYCIAKWYDIGVIGHILVYVASLLPLIIYMPDNIITQQVLSEGVSYSLIYLFYLLILRAVIKQSYICSILAILMGMMLNLIRSQFIIIHLISIFILLFVYWQRSNNKVGNIIFSMLIGLVLLGVIIVSVYKITNVCVMRVYPVIMQEDIEETAEEDNDKSSTDRTGSPGGIETQFAEIAILRGFFFAESDDDRLFRDDSSREVFRLLYDSLEGHGCLYNEAEFKISHWQSMFNEDITREAYNVMKPYYINKGYEGDKLWKVIHREFFKVGITLILAHFGKFCLCFIWLLWAGLMASIFYQKESIYMLCAATTCLMTVLFTWLYRGCKKDDDSMDELCACRCTLICIGVFVVIISAIFFPLQRYLVYFQGAFYTCLYLCIRRQKWISDIACKLHINEEI